METGRPDAYWMMTGHDAGVDLRAAFKELYGIWMLAEEVSGDGRFGKADPTLTMQLILLELVLSAEMENAIDDYFPRWKAGRPHAFDLCQYITSGTGSGFCSERRAIELEKIRTTKLKRFREALKPRVGALLDSASMAHGKFAMRRAVHEQGFFGSARASFAIDSVQEQREEFLGLVVGAGEVKEGAKPQPFRVTDEALNRAWRDLMKKVRSSPGDASVYNLANISEEGLRATQWA